MKRTTPVPVEFAFNLQQPTDTSSSSEEFVMNHSKLWLVLGAVGFLSAPLVYADDTTTDDSATVADEGQTPDDVISALPDQANDMADTHAAFGQSVAAQARDQARTMGREFGQQTASQVRQDAQQNGAASAHRP
jgi:hypothetical protein